MSSGRLNELAKETGFKQRTSVITPEDFLDTIFFSNAQNSPSLSQYSIDLANNSNRFVSKQAIDKRFNERTKDMLTEIIQEVTSAQFSRSCSNKSSNLFSEIRIMDSCEFAVSKRSADKFPGYGGIGREAVVQIQFEYELLQGKVKEFSIGSALDSDSNAGLMQIETVPNNALLIRDLGYFSPIVFKELDKRGIYFISRAKSQWRFYITEGKKKTVLTTQDIINKLKNQKEKYLDIDVIVGANARTPVRLIANLLSEEQTQKRIKKKISHRGKLGKDAEEGACINLFVTNVEREKCDAPSIYQLYRLRWQIELVFKTWKSIFKMHKIHTMNAIRLECVLLIKLLWVMLNWSFLSIIENLIGKELSLHKFTHTFISRSKMLTLKILKNADLIDLWLKEMINISEKHHIKEYKKNTMKKADILSVTHLKIN